MPMSPQWSNAGSTSAAKGCGLKEGKTAAEAAARRIAMETDGTLEAYLRAATAGDFFLAILKYGSVPTFQAIEDGTVMPVGGWIPAIQAGKYNKMPIILGSNEYESKSFMPLYGPRRKFPSSSTRQNGSTRNTLICSTRSGRAEG